MELDRINQRTKHANRASNAYSSHFFLCVWTVDSHEVFGCVLPGREQYRVGASGMVSKVLSAVVN